MAFVLSVDFLRHYELIYLHNKYLIDPIISPKPSERISTSRIRTRLQKNRNITAERSLFDLIKQELEELLKQSICRPWGSFWCSSVHMVPKPNGEWRLCGDYTLLNSQTIPNRYRIPFIHDFAHSIVNCRVFST